MYARHAAYGLDLHASFPLPGMRRARAERLPSVRLDLAEPGAIEAIWSGPLGAPAWSGRLGDGSELTIELGDAGDALFTYSDRARFHLDCDRERLVCAPVDAAELHWQQVLLGRVLPNVALMRGYEALHASAVESPGGVVAIAAPSGTGKTTLALELLGRGWPLFADDVLTVGAGAHPGTAQAHAGTPHMNVAAEAPPATAPEELGETLGVLAAERWIAVEESSVGTRPVRMICLLQRGPELPLAARELPASPLPLAPYMLGLAGDATRERLRFARYSDLMSETALVRLTGDLAASPAAIADLLEEALTACQPLAAGALP